MVRPRAGATATASKPGPGSNYQFGAPPAPSYYPQPSWGGADYYNAHYGRGSPDKCVRAATTRRSHDSHTLRSNLFDYVWSRIKNFVGGSVWDAFEIRDIPRVVVALCPKDVLIVGETYSLGDQEEYQQTQ